MDASEQMAIDNSTLRKFIIPKINFKAKTYPDLIDWNECSFTEPPCTISLSDDELREILNTPLSFPDFPCHTQAVERGIRLVTEAASSVIGADARDGFIRQNIKSRKEVPRGECKAEFFTDPE